MRKRECYEGHARSAWRITAILGGLLIAAAIFLTGHTAYAAMPAADPQDPEYVERLEKGLLGEIPEADSNGLGSGASSKSGDSGVNPYTGNTYVHDSRFNGCEILDGIDVSKWNGTTIDWNRVKAAGIDYVMLRIGYTNLKSEFTMNKDGQFDNYLPGVRAAGLPIGIYYYSQAVNASEAKKEADYVLRLLNGMDLDYPVVFDSENPTGSRLSQANLSPSAYSEVARTFCSRIAAAGYDTMVYSSYSGLRSDYDAAVLESFTNIWLARYVTSKSNYAADYSGKYCMWQYSKTGRVDGIKTYTDCNFYYGGTIDNNASAALTVQAYTSGSSVQLSWNTARGAQSYRIQRAESAGGTFNTIGQVSGTDYTDTGLPEGYAYYYRVIPVTDSGDGAASSVASAAVVYSSPVFVQVTKTVYARSGAGSGFAKKKKVSRGTVCRTDYAAKDVAGRTWYHLSSGGNGFVLSSNCSYAAPALGQVSGVKASGRGKNAITLTWKAQSSATGYQIYRADALNGTYRLVTSVKGTNQVTMTGLKSACTYYFKVRSYYRYAGKSAKGKLSSVRLIATKKANLKVKTRKAATLRKYAGAMYRSLGTVRRGVTLTASYRSRDRYGRWWYYVKVRIGRKTCKGYIPKSMVRSIGSGR